MFQIFTNFQTMSNNYLIIYKVLSSRPSVYNGKIRHNSTHIIKYFPKSLGENYYDNCTEHFSVLYLDGKNKSDAKQCFKIPLMQV